MLKLLTQPSKIQREGSKIIPERKFPPEVICDGCLAAEERARGFQSDAPHHGQQQQQLRKTKVVALGQPES